MQAQEGQALLATQTARGIEGFYGAILDSLDLIATPTRPDAAAASARRGVSAPRRRRGSPGSSPGSSKAARRRCSSSTAARMTRSPSARPTPTLPPAEVVAQLGDWLRRSTGRTSARSRSTAARGYNVVAVPAGERAAHARRDGARARDRGAVARPPRPATSTGRQLLADEADVVMAAKTGHRGSGRISTRSAARSPCDAGTSYVRDEQPRHATSMPEPLTVGGETRPPSMLASEPVDLAGQEVVPADRVRPRRGRRGRHQPRSAGLSLGRSSSCSSMTGVLVSTSRPAHPQPRAARARAHACARSRARPGPPDPARLAARRRRRLRRASTSPPSTSRPATSAATSTTGSTCPTAAPPS